ncbi:MFS transporter [Alcanivorax sp. 24]|uniref:MFS transporter n=1 Tax=Alcanivorax sp. 24 TaxID=2545266 RepID=UPI00105EE588|nr:MFS transporter [Alcanivorax sp. 24]
MDYRWRVTIVFLLGFFLDCINIFMSAIALPDVAQSLAVGPSLVGWVGNAYILGLVVVMPISSWLSGWLGARRLLALSMLLFSVAVLACGNANSFAGLIVWRFIQGLGGGLLIPVGQALVFNLFPGAQRGRVSTVIMATALIAPAFSPTLGGIIVDHGSWRWVFFANVPFSLLTAALAWFWVEKGRGTSATKPDLKGLILIGLVLASVLIALSLYADRGGGIDVIAGLVAALICGTAYGLHQKTTRHPIVDIGLMGNRRLAAAMLVYHAVPGVFTGVNLTAIFYFQTVLGFSAQSTGQFMLFYAAGAMVAMVAGQRAYGSVGARALLAFGVTLHSLGILCLVGVHAAGQIPLLMAAYTMMGIGGGLSANTAQTIALLDFKGRDLEQGSVIWNLNRQIAFSLGVAVMALVFALAKRWFPAVSPYPVTFLFATVLCLSAFSVLPSLNPPLLERES